MSFSWMKPTTLSSRALVSALVFSLTLPGSFHTADADERTARKRNVSYAEELSEVRESIDATESEIERIETEIAEMEALKRSFAKWDRLVENDDPIVNDYSPENCNCGRAAGCDLRKLVAANVVDAIEVTITYLPIGCDRSKGGKERQAQPDPKAEKSAKPTEEDSGEYADGPQGTTGVARGDGGSSSKKSACTSVAYIPVNNARVCKKIFDAGGSKWDPYGETGSYNIPKSCRDAARECGPVKKEIKEGRIAGDIVDLRAELERLKKERKKLIARRTTVDRACPDCKVILDEGQNRPNVGDYILGGINAATPMVVSGINAGMYNRYLKTSLTAYNGYLNNSLAGCQAYYTQGTTLGIPSNPCQSGMWTGGIAAAPGMGGYGVGIGAGIGFPGGIGAGIGFPGGIGAGIGFPGGIGAGSFPGGIGAMIGSAIGASFGYPGGGGMGYVASFGQPGFGMPSYGMGMGMGFPTSIGSPGFNMSFGMGAPGMGMPGFGMPGFGGYGYGGSFAGFSAGSFGGGFQGGFGGGFQGGFAGGFQGGFQGGFGMDPSFMLQQQRAQMQQQNLMISQQQIMEAQQRYQQVAGSFSIGGGGFGYGGGIGGYGYGGGMGFGGYGGVGVPMSIGSAIGQMFGFGGYGYGSSYSGLPY